MMLGGKPANLVRSRSILASSSKNLASIPISYVSRSNRRRRDGGRPDPALIVAGIVYFPEPFSQAGLDEFVHRDPAPVQSTREAAGWGDKGCSRFAADSLGAHGPRPPTAPHRR